MSTCSSMGHWGGEELSGDHVLAFRISGESRTFIGEKMYLLKPGSIGLLRKNTLYKMVTFPQPDGRPFQTIAIYLGQDLLKRISTQDTIVADVPYTGEPAIDLSQDIFLKGFFDSLMPYFTSGVSLNQGLAELKTREAISLLLQHNSRLKNLLFDFSEPFKIDLGAFMAQNFIYHIPLAQFARLSGRSLTTFKRDFKKVFDDAPERWIRRKRLERAHELIAGKKQSPVQVYAEVGFESLSHFSFAFKQHFGYNPSELD